MEEFEEISVQFDPNKIKTTQHNITIGSLIDRLIHNEIVFDTEFRRQFVWRKQQQSHLIESILMRLPLPLFYFDDSEDYKWRIIDGLQRIYTIKNFVIDKNLKLEGLEFLPQLNGYSFTDLPRDLHRRIKAFIITVLVIEKETPKEAKFLLFSRLNINGTVRTAQEIRNALYYGNASNFINKLSEKEYFKRATDNKISSTRMQDKELITRFVAFYLLGYEYYHHNFESFLNRAMDGVNQLATRKITEIEQKFEQAMNTSYDIFGRNAFGWESSTSRKRMPLRKALFEVLSVCFAQLSKEKNLMLLDNKKEFVKRFELLKQDTKFTNSLTKQTSLNRNVLYRFSTIKQILNETL